jgi:hypothetical protein
VRLDENKIRVFGARRTDPADLVRTAAPVSIAKSVEIGKISLNKGRHPVEFILKKFSCLHKTSG